MRDFGSGIVGFTAAKGFKLVDVVEIHESGKDSSARPQFRQIHSRRDFLTRSLAGLGAMALADLMHAEGRTAASSPGDPMAPKPPHFPPTAKNVIFLFQEGAPSQMDLFDPKPLLKKYHGHSLPPEITKDLQLAFIKKNAQVLASERTFEKCGQSGMELSDWIPHTRTIADDICLVRSMYSEDRKSVV